MTAQVSDEAMLVALSEAVSLDAAEQIAADLQTDPSVEWAEPDLFLFSASDPSLELPTGIRSADRIPVGNSVTTSLATTVSVPSDTAYGEQWSLWDTYGIGVGESSARMTSAWASGRGAGATVAVIDTGITSHPDLDGNVLAGFDFVSNPDGLAADRDGTGVAVAFDGDYADTARFGGLGRDGNPTDPGDWRGVAPVRSSSWHGTAMAGIIAAANNADGTTGIAPEAKVVPVRALSWRGGLLSDIAASITWASGGVVDGAPVNAHPADVINLSFAVQATCPVALQAAITDARSRGAVLVAAAGNAAADASLFAPGNCDGVLTVAATGRDGQRAGYSNHGPRIDLSAPGGSNDGGTILAPSNNGDREPVEELPTSTALSGERAVLVGNSIRGDQADGATYRGQLGTSVAAAHVSGAIALLKARNTTLTPDDIERDLTGSVRPFANNTFDPTDPAKTGGTGILSLAQIAAGTCTPTGPTQTADGRTMVTFSYIGNTCTWEVPTGVSKVTAVIVGGGAGGGASSNGFGGGGGGAGGVRVLPDVDVTAGLLMTVNVGTGGIGGSASGATGFTGGQTSIYGAALSNTTYAAAGGGKGGGGGSNAIGGDGGSGGGGGAPISGVGWGGTGNVPSTSPAQGRSGGAGAICGVNSSGGGGGGFGSIGGQYPNDCSLGGAGGAGVTVTEDGKSDGTGTGTTVFTGAGGGGGGNWFTNGAGGAGGTAGGNAAGGSGGSATQSPGGAVLPGSGGGGGTNGSNHQFGGAGSAGVVVLIYEPVGPLHHFAVTNTSGGSIAGQTAGTAFGVKITAQDASNRTVASFTGAGNTVDLTTTSLFKTGASTVASSFTTGTFTSGVLTLSGGSALTLTKAGTGRTITAKKTGGTEEGTSNAFDVGKGATRLIVGLPGQTHDAGQIGGFTGTVSTTVKAFQTFNVSVYLADEFGNLITNAGGSASIALTKNGGSGTLTSSPVTMAQNASSASFTGVSYDKGEPITLTATGTGAGAASGKTGTSASLVVGLATQAALTIDAPFTKPYGASLPLSTSGGSGTGAVSWALSNNNAGCAVTGSAPSYSLTSTGAVGTTCDLTATKAADASYLQAVSPAQTFTVGLGVNTITFTSPPANKTFGDAAFTIAATATSGLPVTFASSTPTICSVTGTLVNILSAGGGGATCTIVASQGGNSNWAAATAVPTNITIAKGNQATLTIDSPATAVYGKTIPLVASGGSGTGARSFEQVSGTCTISGSTLTLGNVGDACSIRAKRAGDDNYLVAYSTDNAAPAQSVTVTQAGQVLSFTSSVPTTPAATDTYTPTAISKSTATNADSGLTPALALSSGTSSLVCTMAGGVVTFHGAGSCVIEATSAATGNFTAATTVSQTIVVGKRNQMITFPQPNNVGYGTSSLTMGAVASSGLVVDYTLGGGTTNSACTVSSLGVVTVLAVGVCEVTASQPATGSTVWAAASPVTRFFQVTASLPTAPTITSVSAGDSAVTLAFSAPSFDGGVAITAYEITAIPTLTPLALVTNSACTAGATPPPCTITLTNGVEYTLTVAAINSAGTGPVSAATAAVTPAAAAFAVADLAATPGNLSLAVSWTPLTTAQLGGGTFDEYQVSYCIASTGCATPGDWTAWSDANLVGAANQGATGTTITGLSNATAYTVRVIAITSANGTPMPGNSATVAESPATLPGTPLSLQALSPTATSLQVSWMVPASNGGSVLSDIGAGQGPYEVAITSTTPGANTPVTCVFAQTTDRFCTVASGLTNGADYTVGVRAHNRIGLGPAATTSFTVASSNPALAGLVVESAPGSPVALTPTFDPTVTAYTATVPNAVASVILTPTAAAAGSVVEVDGTTQPSGVASSPIPLTVGATTVTVLVTAPDPAFTRSYEVVVTRAPAGGNGGGGGGDGSGEDTSGGGGGGTAQNPSTTLPTTVLDTLFGTGNWPPGTNGSQPGNGTGGTGGVDPYAGLPGIALLDGTLIPSTWDSTFNVSGWHVVIPGIGGNGTGGPTTTGNGGAGAGGGSGGVGGTGAAFTMDISARSQAGRAVPPRGQELRVPQYGYVDIHASGFASNAPVGVFAIPLTALTAKTGMVPATPDARALPAGVVQLGSIRADAAGRVDATFPIGDLPIGQYLLQINGQSAAGGTVSVNARMQVVSASETAQVRKAAFFKARTAKLSGKGKARMRALAQAVPADARDVKVAVVGVSLSMGMPSANLRLAGKRADKIVKRLNAKGVHGKYTVTLHVEGDIDAAGNRKVRVLHYNADGDLIVDTQVPAHSAAGRALSTATVTFTTTL